MLLYAFSARLCHFAACVVCSTERERHIVSEAGEHDEDGEEVTSCKTVNTCLISRFLYIHSAYICYLCKLF